METSSLIQNSEEKLKRTRQRLIGSIILLIIALLILLKVTSSIKPVKINSENIKINNTAPLGINTKSVVSAAIVITKKNSSTSTIAVIKNTEGLNAKVNNSTPMIAIVKNNASATIKPELIKINSSAIVASSIVKPVNPKSMEIKKPNLRINNDLQGIIVKDQPNPQDILNNSQDQQYFIQYIVSRNKQKLELLQQQLHRQGINTKIYSLIINGENLYRLRSGPYATKDQAINELTP